jgi:hypothetical protein
VLGTIWLESRGDTVQVLLVWLWKMVDRGSDLGAEVPYGQIPDLLGIPEEFSA